jgi:hypothetical protein
MSDIKQAAKWMQEGKKITGGNALHPLLLVNGEICFDTGKGGGLYPYHLDDSDLLAEDWEIAE